MVEIILVYHDSLLESLSEFDWGGGVLWRFNLPDDYQK